MPAGPGVPAPRWRAASRAAAPAGTARTTPSAASTASASPRPHGGRHVGQHRCRLRRRPHSPAGRPGPAVGQPDPEALGRAGLDGSDLRAQPYVRAQPGQPPGRGLAVQVAEGTAGTPMSAASLPAEQRGLHHGRGQRQAGLVAVDVERRDDEQVPEHPAGPLALPVRRQPVAEPLVVQRRAGPGRGTAWPARPGRPAAGRPAAGSGSRPGPSPCAAARAARSGAAGPRRPGASTVTSNRSCTVTEPVMPSRASRPCSRCSSAGTRAGRCR